MKKKLLSILLTAAMATTVVSGTALIVNADSEGDLSGKTFAIVIRNSGNPYAEKKLTVSNRSLKQPAANASSNHLKKQLLMLRFR